MTFLLPSTGSVGRSITATLFQDGCGWVCLRDKGILSTFQERAVQLKGQNAQIRYTCVAWTFLSPIPGLLFSLLINYVLVYPSLHPDFSASFTSIVIFWHLWLKSCLWAFQNEVLHGQKRHLLYSQPVGKGRKGANSITPRCPRKSGFKVSLLYCKVTCDVASPCMFYSFFFNESTFLQHGSRSNLSVQPGTLHSRHLVLE